MLGIVLMLPDAMESQTFIWMLQINYHEAGAHLQQGQLWMYTDFIEVNGLSADLQNRFVLTIRHSGYGLRPRDLLPLDLGTLKNQRMTVLPHLRPGIDFDGYSFAGSLVCRGGGNARFSHKVEAETVRVARYGLVKHAHGGARASQAVPRASKVMGGCLFLGSEGRESSPHVLSGHLGIQRDDALLSTLDNPWSGSLRFQAFLVFSASGVD